MPLISTHSTKKNVNQFVLILLKQMFKERFKVFFLFFYIARRSRGKLYQNSHNRDMYNISKLSHLNTL